VIRVHGFQLSFGERAVMLALVLAFGGVALALGKDTGWDFRNYHWYDPYALLDGRLGFDVAVAHQATYFNPLIHVPFYLLATVGTSWLAVFYLGALQGLNALPLYVMSRSALAAGGWAKTIGGIRLDALALTVIGLTGSTVLSMVGKTSYDQSLLSTLALCGLGVIVVGRDALELRTRTAATLAAGAGLLVGFAVGLKLTEAPFAVGFAAALLVPRGSIATRCARVGWGALGGLTGVLVTGGYWFLALARRTGNPLFPFFNDVLHSTLIASGSYRDQRFIPEGVADWLSFPFRFSAYYVFADDAPFRDYRVLLLYVLIPLACLLWVTRRRARDPLLRPEAALMLFAFVAASYVAWVAQFAVYRYIVLLEMLAPLVIVAAVGLVPVDARARWVTVALLFIGTFATGRYDPGPHAPLVDPYVQIQGLSLPDPAHSMILMTGEEPMAYLIPALPTPIPVLRIDGLIAGPEDGSDMTRDMRARVAAHRGDLYLLAAVSEEDAAQSAAAHYHLRIVESHCQLITTNLGGPYHFCPLTRIGSIT
jgi:hypothetical protein